MGKIKKITENELVGGTQSTDVYPVTSVKAVYDENNERLDSILNAVSDKLSGLADKSKELEDKKADFEQVNNSLYDLEKKIGDRFVIEGNVTNLPDEEDLTSVKESERNVLKLADRSYAPHNFSGKGYKILRKNIKPVSLAVTKIIVGSIPTVDGTIVFTINGVGVSVDMVTTAMTSTDLVAQKIAEKLTETMTEYEVSKDASTITLTRKFGGSVTPSVFSAGTTGITCTVTDSTKQELRNLLTPIMINQPNTIYEVRYDFDLNGETIEMQEGCTLKFEGGLISNGGIDFNGCYIESNYYCFDSLNIKGNIANSKVQVLWFDDGSHTDVSIKQALELSYYFYYVYGFDKHQAIELQSNTQYKINNPIYIKERAEILGNGGHLRIGNISSDKYAFYVNSIDGVNAYKGYSGMNYFKNLTIRGKGSIKSTSNAFCVNTAGIKLEDVEFIEINKALTTLNYCDNVMLENIYIGEFNPNSDSISLWLGDNCTIKNLTGGSINMANKAGFDINGVINTNIKINNCIGTIQNVHNESCYISCINSHVSISNSFFIKKPSVPSITLGDWDNQCGGYSINNCIFAYNQQNNEQYVENDCSVLLNGYAKCHFNDSYDSLAVKGAISNDYQSAKTTCRIKTQNHKYVPINTLTDFTFSNNQYEDYLCRGKRITYTKNREIPPLNLYAYNDRFGKLSNSTYKYSIYDCVARNGIFFIVNKIDEKSITVDGDKNFVVIDMINYYKSNVPTLIIRENVGSGTKEYVLIPIVTFRGVRDYGDCICNDLYKWKSGDPLGDYAFETNYCETDGFVVNNLIVSQPPKNINGPLELLPLNSSIIFNNVLYRRVNSDKCYGELLKKSGATSKRPVLQNTDIGISFYDTTLNKLIVWNGTAWVNIDGTALL